MRKALLALAALYCAACAPQATGKGVRLAIVETDGIKRPPRMYSQNAVLLLEEPKQAYRRVATVVGMQDAHDVDDNIWEAMRLRAQYLGAHAVWVRTRELVQCETAARSATAVVADSSGTVGSSVSHGAFEHPCTMMSADILILGGDNFDCEDSQVCRNERSDAYSTNTKGRMIPPPKRVMPPPPRNDSAESAQGLPQS